MRPNGDPMFRGSQFNSRINGGQAQATENFFDGAAFGYAVGHQRSHESTPPVEAVQEVKVITTTYSAQYGHTSGGFIEYTSKSGTNAFHGSVYEYFAHDALNKKGFFEALDKTPLRNDNFGVHARRPGRASRAYNGRNKTFFFTNIDYTRIRSGVLPGFGNTTPTDAFKQRRLQRAADRQPGRRRRARPADLRRPDLQSGDDAAGQRHSGARSVSRATSSRPAIRCAARWRLADRAADGAARIGPALEQRRRQSGGRPDVGAGRAQHHVPRRSQLHAELPGRATASTGTAARRSATAARSAAARPSTIRRIGAGRRTPTTTASGFFQRISTHHAHQQFDWVDPRQPAEPLDRRLRPLVHGRQLSSRPARTGRSGCGAPNQRRPRRTPPPGRR